MYRVTVLYENEPDPQEYAAHAEMCRCVPNAVFRHGKVIGVYLSRDRIEALIETMELLGDPGFMKALKEYKSGKMKFVDLEDVKW